MAMHYIGDVFAHDMYRKSSNKLIVHDDPAPSGTIAGADNISVVPRRNDSAQYALEGVVSCALSNVYGDYNEINDGIDAPEYADDKDNYRKIKLYTYLVQCGSDYKLARAARASIND